MLSNISRVVSCTRLQRVELSCDGGDTGHLISDADSNSLQLLINGTLWTRRSAAPAAHNATIHTVHMIYMNHYDVTAGFSTQKHGMLCIEQCLEFPQHGEHMCMQ